MNRTTTVHLTTLRLPPPQQVTLTFPPNNPSHLQIAVPEGSQWQMPLHWHRSNTPGCTSVRCLLGNLHVYISNAKTSQDLLCGPSNRAIVFKAGEKVAWNSSRWDRQRRVCTEDWGVELLVADANLWRNIASAILDRDVYPRLSSTPFWLKLVFGFLRVVPRAREALLSYLLVVQLQAMLYAHDFHQYHGRIYWTWPWMLQPFGGRAPERVRWLQFQSQTLISMVVMGFCYWVGRLVLGMKGEYPEYTRAPQHRSIGLVEKHVE